MKKLCHAAILLASLAWPLALRAQGPIILGKNPYDQWLASLWAQNSNAWIAIQGINANAGTNTFSLALMPPSVANSAGSNYVNTVSNSILAEISAALGSAASPAVTLVGGLLSGAYSVQMTCPTPGAVIHYTTNNTAPTSASAVYTGIYAQSGNWTNKALAIAPLYANSAVAALPVGTIYWGQLASQPATGSTIASLLTPSFASGYAASYPFSSTGYLYFAWPAWMGVPAAWPAGFNANGFPLSLDSGTGFPYWLNWNYGQVTISSVTYNVFSSLQSFTSSGITVLVQ
jgi:hypothetical protein